MIGIIKIKVIKMVISVFILLTWCYLRSFAQRRGRWCLLRMRSSGRVVEFVCMEVFMIRMIQVIGLVIICKITTICEQVIKVLENVCILLTWWILLGFARWGGQWWLSRRSASVGFVGMKLVIMKICEHFVGVLGDSRILPSKMLESSKCSESCSEFVSCFLGSVGSGAITCPLVWQERIPARW